MADTLEVVAEGETLIARFHVTEADLDALRRMGEEQGERGGEE
jgi:hypothetical protein